MKLSKVNLLMCAVIVNVIFMVLYFIYFGSKVKILHSSLLSSNTFEEEGISEVLCFTTHTHRQVEEFAPDYLDIITPSSPESFIRDGYKICIVSNMCVDNSGKVILFLPNSSLPLQRKGNQFFSSDYKFIKKLLIDHPILGAPRIRIEMKVEIKDSTMKEFKKQHNDQIRTTSKWLFFHTPIFWFNYYHTIVDGFYKVYVTLKQISHVMQQVYQNGFNSTLISPTVSYDSIPDIITNKDYEIHIITKSNSKEWTNRIENTTEKAFPQPIAADLGNGDAYTCSNRGSIGISFSHFRNFFYAFEKGIVNRPRKEGAMMNREYYSFIRKQYGYSSNNQVFSKVKSKINIVLVRRTKNRVITNLDNLYQNLTRMYGNYSNIEIRENFNHTFEEQLAYHQRADVIIVSHGADETNALLAREGTVIIEIESSFHFEPYFQAIGQLLNLRFYVFRGSGGDKNSARKIDMDVFIPFFEVALCYGDSFIGNKKIKQLTTQSKFCDWIRSEREYSEQTIEELLKSRVNIFEDFDKDEKLDKVTGKMLVGCCV